MSIDTSNFIVSHTRENSSSSLCKNSIFFSLIKLFYRCNPRHEGSVSRYRCFLNVYLPYAYSNRSNYADFRGHMEIRRNQSLHSKSGGERVMFDVSSIRLQYTKIRIFFIRTCFYLLFLSNEMHREKLQWKSFRSFAQSSNLQIF